MPGVSTLMLVDSNAARRGQRAEALRARGHRVDEVADTLGVLRDLPRLQPEVLVLAEESASVDLDTFARGVRSMPASEHLQILVLGEVPPLGGAAQALVTRLEPGSDLETFVREAERLAARAKRRRQG